MPPRREGRLIDLARRAAVEVAALRLVFIKRQARGYLRYANPGAFSGERLGWSAPARAVFLFVRSPPAQPGRVQK